MARTITTHPTDTINFTKRAQQICQILNTYKELKPSASVAEMAKWWNGGFGAELFGELGQSSIGRYYLGCYHRNDYRVRCNTTTNTLVRLGAKVDISYVDPLS